MMKEGRSLTIGTEVFDHLVTWLLQDKPVVIGHTIPDDIQFKFKELDVTTTQLECLVCSATWLPSTFDQRMRLGILLSCDDPPALLIDLWEDEG
jgi:hypothetical protein